MFPKIGVPQNGWFIMENPIKMDDLGVPLFSEASICQQTWCIRFIASHWPTARHPESFPNLDKSECLTYVENPTCFHHISEVTSKQFALINTHRQKPVNDT